MKKLRELKGIRGALYRAGILRERLACTAEFLNDFVHIQNKVNDNRPPITAIVAGRNDDYMPDFKERLRATIEWNVRYLVKDVVFVEWNPPADRELLSISLANQFKCLKAYVVSPEIHQSICGNSQLPLMEFHAKNVGIRRANSNWIVATNADTAFGPDTIRRVLDADLSGDIIWSAQRIDIAWRTGRETGVNMFDCLRYRRMIPYTPLGTGEFAFASKQLWERIGGYDEALVRHRIGVDKRGVAQMVAHGARIERAGTIFHLSHPTSCTEAIQEHHGELASLDGLPYENKADWGLANHEQVEISGRVWLLK